MTKKTETTRYGVGKIMNAVGKSRWSVFDRVENGNIVGSYNSKAKAYKSRETLNKKNDSEPMAQSSNPIWYKVKYSEIVQTVYNVLASSEAEAYAQAGLIHHAKPATEVRHVDKSLTITR